MKLSFIDETIEFKQTPSVDRVIEVINELLQENYFFSHFIVDGKEVKEEPETFLSLNLSEIDLLEIVALTTKEFINELLLSTEKYTERALPQIESLSDAFYSNPSASDWTELANLFEGIQWIVSMEQTIDHSSVRPFNWNEVQEHTLTIQGELENLEEALRQTDNVLIADILQYEILPAFKAVAKEVQKTIDTEGIRHDFN